MSAAEKWRIALAAWAIPKEILEQAPESPWIHPPELFEVPDVIPSSPSIERAREALGIEGSVLDVGCGGGNATFALVPDVRWAAGVDQQVTMLEMYQRNGDRFAVPVQAVHGDWPTVAQDAPVCDVAVAHHVVYNVGDIVPFLTALNDHARHRVVVEMPCAHPLASMSDAWRHFWNIERPTEPTPTDFEAVVVELGLSPRIETWDAPVRNQLSLDQAAHFMRIRLCLPEEREFDVRAYLASTPPRRRREMATVWWDTAS